MRVEELRKIGLHSFLEWSAQPNTVYIGRANRRVKGVSASKWANPFRGEGSLEKYREYVMRRPELVESLPELKGKRLGCWCKPEPCHGDVLVSLIEASPSVSRSFAVNPFCTTEPAVWEEAYRRTIDWKYQKGIRNFSRKIVGTPVSSLPNIYIIPRVRGESYKQVNLLSDDPQNIQFCPISKGYSMQDVSSFTLGPVIGEGLCVVNAAFSKIVCLMHLEGGGKMDAKRRNLWRKGKPVRRVTKVNDQTIEVDGVVCDTKTWLLENKALWFEEWKTWSRAVALHHVGSFHWDDGTETVAFFHREMPIGFVAWKKECYIKPAMELLRKEPNVMPFLSSLLAKGISIGLVHPKGRSEGAEVPITKDFLRSLFDGDEMACMPYVVAGVLLSVSVD